jgi:hypothetical protein
MAVGKKTGGRTRGVPNKRTAARRAAIAASGEQPLDYMLGVMRDKTADWARRDHMAKAAAPFCHPTLASTKHSGDGPDGAILFRTVYEDRRDD